MASSLQSIFSLPSSSSLNPTRQPDPKPHFTVRCGRRDGRGPLVKGRILSIEAIQAVQSLKRNHKTLNDAVLSKTLTRLVKSDLMATFNELLRQDQTELAVKVFAVIRSEFWYTADLIMYANLVSALARKGKGDEIDGLICDLDGDDCVDDGVIGDGKGLVMLIKAVIEARRVESTVRIYRMMMRSGWRPRCSADDYVVNILRDGLRRLGDESVAQEISRVFGTTSV